ncbi:MAG: DUF3619 family protein [Proteobacteria bacterium]|nr:DUF3619 family protein [Pseudomonadota bacterium]
MNELQFGNQIRQALNEGARLPAALRERLRASRERALARRRIGTDVVLAGGVLGRFGGLGGFSVAVLVPVLLLVIGLASLHSARQNLVAEKQVEIDTQLLSDELPIDAYLDKGFEKWLKKQRRN